VNKSCHEEDTLLFREQYFTSTVNFFDLFAVVWNETKKVEEIEEHFELSFVALVLLLKVIDEIHKEFFLVKEEVLINSLSHRRFSYCTA
jgi:hypothetical protein